MVKFAPTINVAGPLSSAPGTAITNTSITSTLALGSTIPAVTGTVTFTVFGPQTGYQVPVFLHEVDLHGPGLHARGVAFAGSEVYVQLGHGVDYAWSATSAGADITDQRIEKLCTPPGGPPGGPRVRPAAAGP